MGFKDEKVEVKKKMESEFTSPLIDEMRKRNGVIVRGELTVKLAEFFGFCWGVERAVSDKFFHFEETFLIVTCCKQIAMAYEARSHFPDRTIYITNEIIHNPQVI